MEKKVVDQTGCDVDFQCFGLNAVDKKCFPKDD